MKNKNHTYKQKLSELRNISPILEEPELFTREIISRIDGVPQTQPSKRRLSFLLSGIAASLLLCFWGYELFRFPEYNTTIPVASPQFSYPGQQCNTSYSIREKINLYVRWQKEQQQNKKRREHFISTLSNLEK